MTSFKVFVTDNFMLLMVGVMLIGIALISSMGNERMDTPSLTEEVSVSQLS